MGAWDIRGWAAIVAAIGCILTASGCGSGSDAADGPTRTKAVYIKQGDALCAQGRKRARAEFTSYLKKNKITEIGGKGESAAETKDREIESIETIAIPVLRKQADELAAFGVPGKDEDEAEATAYLEAVNEGIEEAEENPQLLFSSPEKVFAKSDKIAKKLGFKVCGNH